MLANIAADRGLDPAALRATVEATPFTAQIARERGLIDQIGRPEDAQRAALARAEGSELVELIDYHPRPHTSGPVIAVIQGEGAIVSGPQETSIFGGEPMMNSDIIARALLDASEDEDVKAIVFRVSSPGGSVVASDQILAALRTAQEREKIVVVSMGEVAASGGYYVSTYADEIVADPSTLTGSIGVFGGKLVIGPAMEHYLSSNTETISVGSPVIGGWSGERPFNQAERAAVTAFIDRAYSQFLTYVSDSRGLTVEQAREVARGRVWTGSQALERGLVDHLGGFSVAVERAKALAGIEEDTRVQLRLYPQAEDPFKELQRAFGVSAQSAQTLAEMNAVLSDPRFQRALAAIREEDAAARAEAAYVDVR
jgi:protease-4